MSKLVKELDILKEKQEKDFNGDHIVKQAEVLLLDSHNKDNAVLEMLGLDHQIKYTQKLENDYRRGKIAEQTYKRKSYSGSDIKKLCNEYDLRMLPVEYYNGEIPSDLARIVSEFCEENDIIARRDAFYILAPTEMFNTIKHVPINLDPILFYKEPNPHSSKTQYAKVSDTFINVHYWGNDFSPLRRFRYLFSKYVHRTDEFSNWTRTGIFGIILFIVFILNLIGSFIPLYIPMVLNIVILALIGIPIFNFSISNKINNLNELWNDDKV